MMKQCWIVLPEKRPAFSQIVADLQEFISKNELLNDTASEASVEGQVSDNYLNLLDLQKLNPGQSNYLASRARIPAEPLLNTYDNNSRLYGDTTGKKDGGRMKDGYLVPQKRKEGKFSVRPSLAGSDVHCYYYGHFTKDVGRLMRDGYLVPKSGFQSKEGKRLSFGYLS